MSDDMIQRAKWERFFSAGNRIEANFVSEHPVYPAHDHEFIEIQMIVAGSCLQHSSLGESHPGPGDVFLFRPGARHAFEQVHGLDLYNYSLVESQYQPNASESLIGNLMSNDDSLDVT
jgi:hypothetical protein